MPIYVYTITELHMPKYNCSFSLLISENSPLTFNLASVMPNEIHQPWFMTESHHWSVLDHL